MLEIMIALNFNCARLRLEPLTASCIRHNDENVQPFFSSINKLIDSISVLFHRHIGILTNIPNIWCRNVIKQGLAVSLD